MDLQLLILTFGFYRFPPCIVHLQYMFPIYTDVNVERKKKSQNLTHCEVAYLNRSPSRSKSINLANLSKMKVSGQNSICSSLLFYTYTQNSWFQRWEHWRLKESATFTLPIAVQCKEVQNSSRWAHFPKVTFPLTKTSRDG